MITIEPAQGSVTDLLNQKSVTKGELWQGDLKQGGGTQELEARNRVIHKGYFAVWGVWDAAREMDRLGTSASSWIFY